MDELARPARGVEVGRTRGKTRQSSRDQFGSFKGYEATSQPQPPPLAGSLAPNDHVKPVVGPAQTDFYPFPLGDRRDKKQSVLNAGPAPGFLFPGPDERMITRFGGET